MDIAIGMQDNLVLVKKRETLRYSIGFTFRKKVRGLIIGAYLQCLPDEINDIPCSPEW